MAATSNSQLALRSTHVDTDAGASVHSIDPSSSPIALVNRHPETAPNDNQQSLEVAQPEEKDNAVARGAEESWVQDLDYLATGDEDEALVLEDDPANMSSWTGQPSVKGSSEVMRMMLLTFSSVGMTYVSTTPGVPSPPRL
jgi:solute carrier family 45 protein 1/2/4